MRRSVLVAALGLGFAACADAPVALVGTPAPTDIAFARDGGGDPIPGRYIVQFRDDEGDVDGKAVKLALKHAGRITHVYKSAVKGMALELPDDAVAALRADPSVLLVEADQTVSISATQANATWGIDRIDQRTLPLSSTYTYNADGSGVTVYIIDTGILLGHAEFTGRVSTGFDAVTAGGTANDCNGHGSHVAGTTGGTTYGVAKNVKLVAVRVLSCSGSGATSGVIAGVDWVTANRKLPAVANMSLGGGLSSTLNTAVRNSIAAGVAYAVAAGNSSADACSASPASEPTATTVGATTISDGFASYSNRGSCVDINAPGSSITSAWYTSATATNTISGTSMASPHVAGAMALYLQVNPAATPAQVDAALKSNASTTAVVPAGTTNRLLYTAFISGGPITPPEPSPAPVPSFTKSCSSRSCTFNAGATTNATSYSWDFGNGKTGTGVSVSHTFSPNRSYTVTLTATGTGGSASTSQPVTCTRSCS